MCQCGVPDQFALSSCNLIHQSGTSRARPEEQLTDEQVGLLFLSALSGSVVSMITYGIVTKPSKVAGTGSLCDLSIHLWYLPPLPDGQLRSPVDIDVQTWQ
jgi:hypothetical protein